jgi:hypothetical protein
VLCFGLAVALGFALVGGANPPQVTPAGNSASAEKAEPSPLDVPLQWMAEARKAYQEVRDYTCLLVKREKVRGQLQPENWMTMKVRTKPFSVYLNWQGPRDLEGQEACCVDGMNQGKMRVHPKGAAGLFGFVTIDPRDPRVLEHSRHLITEAGIGNLIDRFTRGYEQDRKLGQTQVRMAEYEYDKKRCVRIETIHPDAKEGSDDYYRCLLYIDKETRLPIRCDCYDRPRDGGNAEGELVESYSFTGLRLNVGLGDSVFQK